MQTICQKSELGTEKSVEHDHVRLCALDKSPSSLGPGAGRPPVVPRVQPALRRVARGLRATGRCADPPEGPAAFRCDEAAAVLHLQFVWVKSSWMYRPAGPAEMQPHPDEQCSG